MNDEVKIEYPLVNVEMRFREDGLWFNAYMPLNQYWALLTSGVADEFTVHEIKIQEWTPEDEEFKYSYMAYNPLKKTWRIGYAT